MRFLSLVGYLNVNSWKEDPVVCMKRERETNLVLFQETPFLTLKRLGALFVVAPLDCVAHGRHDGEWWFSFLLFSAAVYDVGALLATRVIWGGGTGAIRGSRCCVVREGRWWS